MPFVIIIALLIFVITVFVVIGFVLNKQNLPAMQADVALVFGTGLEWKAKSRWLRAAQLFKNGLVRYIIVSGGVLVPQQTVTEAEWFRKNLISLGIPPEKIILENRATNALENADIALPILQQHNFRSVIPGLSDFTGLRAFLTAKKAWLGNSCEIEGYGETKRCLHIKERTPDAGDSALFSPIFLHLTLFLVGRLRRLRPNARQRKLFIRQIRHEESRGVWHPRKLPN